MSEDKRIVNWKRWIPFLCMLAIILVLALRVFIDDLRNKQSESTVFYGDSDLVLDEDIKTFDEWQKINSDVTMVLYLGEKSYPISPSGNNQEYLETTSGSASLYIAKDFSAGDPNLVLYIQRDLDKNSLMLKLNDSEFIRKNQVFYIETAEGMMSYQVTGYFYIDGVDEVLSWVRTNFGSDDELISYLDLTNKKTNIKFNNGDLNSDFVVTLVSCDKSKKVSEKRLIIVATPQ